MATTLKVLDAEIPSLLRHLQTYEPAPHQAIGLLRASLENTLKAVCLVDQFPEGFTTVIVHLPVCKPHENIEESVLPQCFLNIFTTDINKFERIFRDNWEMFDWSKRRALTVMEPAVTEVVERILTGASLRCLRHGPYALMECPTKDLPDTEPPPGFKFGRLSEENVDDIIPTWNFSAPGCEKMISFLVNNYTSVTLLTEGGELVGWYLEQLDSSQGMLYIIPKFRGQRLSRYLIEKLKRKIVAKDQVPFVTVATTNETSLRAHAACGYTLSGCDIFWIFTERVM